MIVWLINPGEPLPLDDNQRLFRTGKLAYKLKDNHEVIWFTSKFDHFTKTFRDLDEKELDGIRYKFINSIGYKKNLSVRRIFDHIILGFNLFYFDWYIWFIWNLCVHFYAFIFFKIS